MRQSVIALNCLGHVDEIEACWRLWPVRNSPTLPGGVFNFSKRFSDREPLRPNLASTAVKERLIHDFKGLTRGGRPLSRWKSAVAGVHQHLLQLHAISHDLREVCSELRPN
jgi:hypothetical protein